MGPEAPVAQATERARAIGGRMLSQGLFSGWKQYPAAHPDKPMASR